ncbi:ribonuclease P [Candidatus Woesearchaeota archaeon]|nr:ribonuclease P [Candidatus Woesearchaeota archaeon]
MRKVSEKNVHRRIALERIDRLFELAQAIFSREPALADRYVAIARKIQTRFKVRMPRELKGRFCKKCGAYWAPGKTVRIRTREGKVVYFCLRCKGYRRIPTKD